MALVQVTPGNFIFAEDLNQIIRLITGIDAGDIVAINGGIFSGDPNGSCAAMVYSAPNGAEFFGWDNLAVDYLTVHLDGNNLYLNQYSTGQVYVGNSQFTLVGKVAANTTQSSSTGVGSTLASVTVPAKTLDVNGKILRVRACGDFANNGNTKGVNLFFGSAQIATEATITSGGSWVIDAIIVRTGSSAERAISKEIIYSTSLSTGNFNNTIAVDTTVAQTLAVKCGHQGANGDVTFAYMTVEVLN